MIGIEVSGSDFDDEFNAVVIYYTRERVHSKAILPKHHPYLISLVWIIAKDPIHGSLLSAIQIGILQWEM